MKLSCYLFSFCFSLLAMYLLQGFKVTLKIRDLAYLRQRGIQMFHQPANKLSISGRVKRARAKKRKRAAKLARASPLLCFEHVLFKIEGFSYDLEKMDSASVRYLFYQPMDEKIKAQLLRFPAKENPYMEKALFYWPVVLQYDVKAKYRLISRKFSDMKFCHPSVRLTSQKPRTFLYPFDKPIKSLYFRLFVISVLFARFQFKVIRKSLYPPNGELARWLMFHSQRRTKILTSSDI